MGLPELVSCSLQLWRKFGRAFDGVYLFSSQLSVNQNDRKGHCGVVVGVARRYQRRRTLSLGWSDRAGLLLEKELLEKICDGA